MRTYRLRVSAGFTVDYQNEAFCGEPGDRDETSCGYFELRHDPARPRDELAEAELFLAVADEARCRPVARRGSDPPLVPPSHRRDHGRTRSSPTARFLSFKIRSAAVPDMPRPYPALRDLRLLDGDGGHPPARREGRARRHSLVGPAGGLPHRGPRPDEDADDEERRHRADRIEGRIRAFAARFRPRSSGRGPTRNT